MKVKTADLFDLSLDWAVAVCEGLELDENGVPIWFDDDGLDAPRVEYSPCKIWNQGGPIIDRMMQGKFFLMENDDSCCHVAYSETEHDNAHGYGPTPLIAACRCFVASRFGDEVEVPDELMKISS